MKRKRQTKLFDNTLVSEAIRQSFIKLNPRIMLRNPVMFTVEVGTAYMFAVCLWILSGETSQGSFSYNFSIFIILLLTVLFANFAEALAEARGKAQADSLRKTREDTPAKKIFPLGDIYVNEVKIVRSSELKKGDVFLCETGDIIPMDGEIIDGIATIDESAITGESAPVIRESGGDKSSVTGGTKVLSDKIKVKVTTEAGESFLDKMIALVEGASRQKTPNEIALTILLASYAPLRICFPSLRVTPLVRVSAVNLISVAPSIEIFLTISFPDNSIIDFPSGVSSANEERTHALMKSFSFTPSVG